MMNYNFKSLVSALAFLPAITVSQFAGAVEITKPKAVVELFTSQGCHACPPADKTFTKIIKDKDILGLAFHVDYWDRLGWKDTFGSEGNTLRQYNYAWAMQLRSAYTPQAIINGRTQIIGTKDDKIVAAAYKHHDASQGMTIPIQVEKGADDVTVKIAGSEKTKGATVLVVYYDELSTVKVEGGANRGKTIDYANIVKEVEIIGQLDGSDYEMTLPLVHFQVKGHEKLAIILQSADETGLPASIDGAVVLSDFNAS